MAAQYICSCGQPCTVKMVNGFVTVTCHNPKCPEYEKAQLPAYRKHRVIA